MKKVFIFLTLIFIQQIFASTVIINKEYKQDIFNMELKNIPEIYIFSDIEKELEKQYAFNLITIIPEIDSNKRYFKDNKKLVGDFITEICDTFDAVAEVNMKDGIIKLTPMYSTFAKFPYGWDLPDTLKELEINYPNISFKIAGDRIYAYGTEKQINEISPVLNNLEYSTNKKFKFVVQIYTYTTNEPEQEFLGFKKDKLSYRSDKLLLQDIIHLKHNETMAIQFLDNVISIKLNLVKEKIIFNGQYELPLNELSNVGFVFTEKQDINNLWDDKKGKRKYIIELKYDDF